MCSIRFSACAVAAAAAIAMTSARVSAIDGAGIPSDMAGSLIATQVNPTGFGDNKTVSEQGILVGSELDSLWVNFDQNDLWIGIVGNLPNKVASSQSIVILIDGSNQNDEPVAGTPNLLAVSTTLPGYGGGQQALINLGNTILEPGFEPETAIVVNRFGEQTYVDSWYLPQNFQDCFVLPDCFSTTLVDPNPYNGEEISVWMDTTNVVGVDSNEALDGTGAGSQEEKAAGAVKGLRIRIDRAYYGFYPDVDRPTLRMMVILTAPDGTVSNQILPPLIQGDDPVAPCDQLVYPYDQGSCLMTPKANFDNAYVDPGTMLPGRTGLQLAEIDYPEAEDPPGAYNTPGAAGLDGSDIPAGFGGTAVAVQQIHTSFGDAVNGTLIYNTEGSELDQMFARVNEAMGQLELGITGNLEDNGNKLVIFIDADPTVGENLLDSNGDPADNFSWLRGWEGRKLDADFAPEKAFVVSNFDSGGVDTLYVDKFNLLEPNVAPYTNVKVYMGSVGTGTGSGVLTGGDNPNGSEFAFDNSNDLGVLGIGDMGGLGLPSSATFGLEAVIKFADLGITSQPCRLKIMAIVAGGDGGYLSNQCLAGLPVGSGNLGNEGTGDPDFDFSAIAGDQFATLQKQRKGDLFPFPNPDCCLNANDASAFVLVAVGLDTNPAKIAIADVYPPATGDGVINGNDVAEYVGLLFDEPACP